MELEARRMRIIRGIMKTNSIEKLDAMEQLLKGKHTTEKAKAKPAVEETEFISKKEILAGIREGLLEVKEARRTGKQMKTAEELLDEL